SSRRRHTRFSRDWSSDVCSSDLLEEVRARHIHCDVLYLDADDETLLKRFSETRRRHPLTNDTRSLAEAIQDEHLLLGPISDLAEIGRASWRGSGSLRVVARRDNR